MTDHPKNHAAKHANWRTEQLMKRNEESIAAAELVALRAHVGMKWGGRIAHAVKQATDAAREWELSDLCVSLMEAERERKPVGMAALYMGQAQMRCTQHREEYGKAMERLDFLAAITKPDPMFEEDAKKREAQKQEGVKKWLPPEDAKCEIKSLEELNELAKQPAKPDGVSALMRKGPPPKVEQADLPTQNLSGTERIAAQNSKGAPFAPWWDSDSEGQSR